MFGLMSVSRLRVCAGKQVTAVHLIDGATGLEVSSSVAQAAQFQQLNSTVSVVVPDDSCSGMADGCSYTASLDCRCRHAPFSSCSGVWCWTYHAVTDRVRGGRCPCAAASIPVRRERERPYTQ